MKGFSRFAKHSSILLSLLLAFAWLFYYLHLYAYLPNQRWVNSFLYFIHILLYAVPILILILLFSLLMIRKARFRRLNKQISVYLIILFLLHCAASIYSSHQYTVTDCFSVTHLRQDHNFCYVTIMSNGNPLTLHCHASDYRKLATDKSYMISYIGNDLLTKLPPTILHIEDDE